MRGKHLAFLLVAPVVMALALSSPVLATLFGLSSSTPGSLYTIDPATGQASLVNDLVGTLATSLVGLSCLDRVLYGTDVVPTSVGHYSIGTIGPGTGQFTYVGDQDGSSDWHGLASDESAGLLYTIDIDDSNKLKSMTPAGLVATIGAGAGIDGRGMAYDDTHGILYATGNDSLYTVDTTTGNSTSIGSMGIADSYIGLAYDEINAILYANSIDGDGAGYLYTLNVLSGAANLVGSNNVGSQIDGLAWCADQPQVPEPATLAFGLIALAAAAVKRRLA